MYYIVDELKVWILFDSTKNKLNQYDENYNARYYAIQGSG